MKLLLLHLVMAFALATNFGLAVYFISTGKHFAAPMVYAIVLAPVVMVWISASIRFSRRLNGSKPSACVAGR